MVGWKSGGGRTQHSLGVQGQQAAQTGCGTTGLTRVSLQRENEQWRRATGLMLRVIRPQSHG